jgi:hypothetical protein
MGGRVFELSSCRFKIAPPQRDENHVTLKSKVPCHDIHWHVEPSLLKAINAKNRLKFAASHW